MANRTKIKKLEELIKDSIGGQLVDQTVTSLLPPGENYGSVMYKVDFKVKKGGKEEEYHAVAKCTPLNTVTQELFNTQETFKSEIAWYTTVIPTLKQFQKDHGVEKEIYFFQQFYGARISLDLKSDKVDLDGAILTQNLKYLGYYNVDRHIGFDLPTTYTILRDLATFHAVPLAMKLQNPRLFDEKIKPYTPRFGDMGKKMIDELNEQYISLFKEIPECQCLINRIKKNLEEAKLFDERPIREPWVTLIHKDAWMNNLMITGGKNFKTMILDFQSPAIGSPAADFVLFLLASVRLDVVQDHFDEFVKFYYKEFIKNLKELKVSTEDFTFEGLTKEMAAELKIGAFNHIIVHTIIILGEKGKSDMDASDPNLTMDSITENIQKGNEKQIEKFKWIAEEAAARNWI